MRLAAAPAKYDLADQARLRATIERADDANFKRGQDVELQPGQRLILPDTVTGDRYLITVASGVLTATAL